MEESKMRKHAGVLLMVLSALGILVMWKTAGEIKTSGGSSAETTSLVHREAPKMALTFDDGPNRKYTPLLLEGLKERGVVVTFFLMGKNIEGNEELVQQMETEGHLIGNHTYHHVQLSRISKEKARREIEKTGNEIYEITGNYPLYVRPPFGEWPKNLEQELSVIPVLWDIDTLDWKCQDTDMVVNAVKENAKDGSIVLMHDGYASTVEAVFQIVDYFLEQGYEFVTVDRLLEV